MEGLEWCWRYVGWVFFGGKCEELLGYLAGSWVIGESLRRVQDEESGGKETF